MGFALKDTALKQTKALPNGVASTTSDAINLVTGPRDDFLADCEVKISAPALVVGDLANDETMKYDLIHSVNADLSSPATLLANVIIQTGAGGAGAAAQTWTGRLPVDVRGYIGVKATNSASGDASDKSMTIELLF